MADILQSVSKSIRENNDYLIKSQDIARDISDHNVKLLTLVEELGGILTDTNPEIRSRGVQFLSQVLLDLPSDFLLEADLHFIVMFYCDRLKDHHSVIPATLQGILAVVSMENLPKTAPQIISSTMSQHIFCQSQAQSDRFTYYRILQIFFQKWKNEFLEVAPDFVLRVITAIDGERDPRNLLLLFDILPYFLSDFPLGNLAEDMFDVMSCYFPVEFRAPRDDPSSVTREDLSSKLQNCLLSNTQFGDFCMPLLMDKLKSDLRLAKIDSLQLLKECCKTYQMSVVRPHWYELWTILRMEVLPGVDLEVRDIALEALQSVIKLFSTAPQSKAESKMLSTALNDVFSSTKGALQDVELSLFFPATKTLLAVANASSSACEEVLALVAPLFIEQYNMRKNTEGCTIVLSALTSFLVISHVHKIVSSNNSTLESIWRDITEIYLDACSNCDYEVRKEGFRGLAVFLKCLNKTYIYRLLNCLIDSVKHENFDSTRTEMLSCLKAFSEEYPDEIIKDIEKLKISNSQEHSEYNADVTVRCMDALCKISAEEPLTSCIIPYVLNTITQTQNPTNSSAGLQSLRSLVVLSQPGDYVLNYLYKDCDVISVLMDWWFNNIFGGISNSIFSDMQLLSCISKTLGHVFRSQPTSEQQKMVHQLIKKFIQSEPLAGGDTFPILDYRSPPHLTQLVCILEALLCSVHQDVDIPWFVELTSFLTSLATNSSDLSTKRSSCRLLSSLINKRPSGEALTLFLKELLERLLLTIKSTRPDTAQKKDTVMLFGWITKALVMRGHEEAEKWIDTLTELLRDDYVGSDAAECFKLIMEQDEEFLNAKCYCNIRILYRQRFFLTSRKLVSIFPLVPANVKGNFLIALAHLLYEVPTTVLLTNLQEVVPLLLESLQYTEVKLLLSTLGTLRNLLEMKHECLIEHFTFLSTKFLDLARYQGSMKVRIASLQCLFQLCQYPTHCLLPFKNDVVKKLGPCLEDPKRLVRNEATTTRSRWFFIGAPGEPENS